jgi:hypothetical protein
MKTGSSSRVAIVVPDQIVIKVITKLKLYGFGGKNERFTELLKILEQRGNKAWA